MALTKTEIIDAALALLRENGLGGLSMRRLAADLGVQAGALYWHVPSKQDLLAEIAERILTDSEISTADARQACCDLRDALLPVRDSAEVVSFALALRPDGLGSIGNLRTAFSAMLPPPRDEWAARTLTHYVLGATAEEQNDAELIRAGIRPADTDNTDDTDDSAAETGERTQRFLFGVDTFLAGLAGKDRR
jgi:AcrR family transcriptional regulator